MRGAHLVRMPALSPPPARRPSLPSLIAALPDFGLAGLFLATWIAPRHIGVDRIGTLMLVMLLEFIVVHSAGFMGAAALAKESRRARIRTSAKFAACWGWR